MVKVYKHPDPDNSTLRLVYGEEDIFELAHHPFEPIEVEDVPAGWIELVPADSTSPVVRDLLHRNPTDPTGSEGTESP